MSQQPEVAGMLMERGADPARGDEMVPFGAKALVAILLATDQHDPVSGNSTGCQVPVALHHRRRWSCGSVGAGAAPGLPCNDRATCAYAVAVSAMASPGIPGLFT